jgi:hypothetical protein
MHQPYFVCRTEIDASAGLSSTVLLPVPQVRLEPVARALAWSPRAARVHLRSVHAGSCEGCYSEPQDEALGTALVLPADPWLQPSLAPSERSAACPRNSARRSSPRPRRRR